MPKGVHLDLGRIHRQLWERSDRMGRVRINQVDLADDLGITKFTISRVMAKLVEQERLRQISSKRQNCGVFVVKDPEEWEALHASNW